MRKRLTVLISAAALLLVGAAPVYAAPGGVPGPPAEHKTHEKPHGNPHDQNTTTPAPDPDPDPDPDTDTSHVPDWANAYGRRIIDEFGMPYGHLQQCADQSDTADDEVADEAPGNGGVICPEQEVALPEDAPGAKAFWLFFQLMIDLLPM